MQIYKQFSNKQIFFKFFTSEEVVESIGALEEMFTAGDDDAFEIRDVIQNKVRVTKDKMMGVEYLYFHTDGYAGYSQIDKGSFKKLGPSGPPQPDAKEAALDRLLTNMMDAHAIAMKTLEQNDRLIALLELEAKARACVAPAVQPVGKNAGQIND